jgi:hypothetical protein
MPDRKELLSAALRLHAYLTLRHYRDGLLRGPDAGVRFNLRAWRFLKSAFSSVAWGDDHVFIQSQGYWILANWMLFEWSGEGRYRQVALESTEATLRLQTAEGYWRYPLPERKHLIATVEGNWGATGLLATYAREPREAFRTRAVAWYDFLVSRIGFLRHAPGEAVNYFQNPRGKVPNNSVEAVWFCLRLWNATANPRFLEHVDPMLEFIASVQLTSGELPYVVANDYEAGRKHYLCYQYNAFQFLKLAWSERVRPNLRTTLLLHRLARFLEHGVTAQGASARDCWHAQPEVDYYTAVLGSALWEAERRGLTSSPGMSGKCFARLLSHQRADGGFDYSTGDYRFLRDTRSYPRPMAMTLFHLLYAAGLGNGFERTGES